MSDFGAKNKKMVSMATCDGCIHLLDNRWRDYVSESDGFDSVDDWYCECGVDGVSDTTEQCDKYEVCMKEVHVKEKIKIVANGTCAHVYLNGKDIAGELVGYSISQEAGMPCVVDLHYRLYPAEVDFENCSDGGDN